MKSYKQKIESFLDSYPNISWKRHHSIAGKSYSFLCKMKYDKNYYVLTIRKKWNTGRPRRAKRVFWLYSVRDRVNIHGVVTPEYSTIDSSIDSRDFSIIHIKLWLDWIFYKTKISKLKLRLYNKFCRK